MNGKIKGSSMISVGQAELINLNQEVLIFCLLSRAQIKLS